MSDLISRADVFEIIDKAFSQPMRNGVTLYADICLMLNTLPTHANSRSTHERDLINRADAIEAVGEWMQKEYGYLDLNRAERLIDALSALPSADAEFADLPSYAEFTDLPDIPRYYYEKVVGKMAHEINVLKEQFESAVPNCQKCAIKELWKEIEKEELVSVVRCKDCRHANECHKSVQYTHNEQSTVTIGYTPIEWCSRGERKGGDDE